MQEYHREYQLYEYKGWNLLEVIYPFTDEVLGKIIIWGQHKGCGYINLTDGTHKPYCRKCHTYMPEEVYIHLKDAIEFLRSTLTYE